MEIAVDVAHEVNWVQGREIRYIAKKQGVQLNLHGDLQVPFCIPERGEWRDAHDRLTKSIRSAILLGAHYVNFHACLNIWLELMTYAGRKLTAAFVDGEGNFWTSILKEKNTLEWFVREKDDSGDIWVQPSDSAATPRPLISTPANENLPRLSPDGRWIAYQSDESGRNEIWVSPFSPTADTAQQKKTRVSVDGGDRPTWSPDGRELFFRDGSRRIMGAEVKSATNRGLPVFGAPRVVLDRPALDLGGPYDVSPLDGRFVTALRELGEGATNQIFVVLNWHTELAERMR